MKVLSYFRSTEVLSKVLPYEGGTWKYFRIDNLPSKILPEVSISGSRACILSSYVLALLYFLRKYFRTSLLPSKIEYFRSCTCTTTRTVRCTFVLPEVFYSLRKVLRYFRTCTRTCTAVHVQYVYS